MRYSPAAPKRRKKEGANSSDLAPLPVNKTGNTSFELLVVRLPWAAAHFIYNIQPLRRILLTPFTTSYFYNKLSVRGNEIRNFPKLLFIIAYFIALNLYRSNVYATEVRNTNSNISVFTSTCSHRVYENKYREML